MKCKVAFVGTGIIGTGLAVNAAVSGHPTHLYDLADPAKVKATVEGILTSMVNAGAVSQADADAALGRMSFTQNLNEALEGAGFVQECVPERIALKQETYKKIQEVLGNSVIIASSTTGIFPTVLQEGALYPEKIVVGHPYNPSYLLPLVEVCGGQQTAPETVTEAMAMYEDWGKVSVHCRKEVNGFIANILNWTMRDACMKAVLDGVCSVEDVDKALTFGPGMRMAVTGQLLTLSLGVDGGFREMAKKYSKDGTVNPEEDRINNIIADGIDVEIANRPAENGNTVEGVIEFRDKMLATIVKGHGLIK